jgi:hypothetical protein
MPKQRNKHRIIDTFAILSVVVFIGFYTKLYHGVFYEWVNNSLSGVLYEVFWCLVFSFPGKWSKKYIAIGVFSATSILEFLQLWHPPFLKVIRSYQAGGYILGTTFQWSDFLYYAIGCWLGYKIIVGLEKKPM